MTSTKTTLLGAFVAGLVAAAAAGLLNTQMNAARAASAALPGAGAAAESAGMAGNLLLERLRRVRPDIPINSVSPSAAPGIYALELDGGSMLYGTADGRYMFSGDLYAIGDTELVNIAEARRETVRAALISEVAVGDAWVFKPVGAPKAVVSVFTDVDCGYCRKLHAEVPRLNELGIEVRYLAYPRAGIGSESYNTIVSAWCANDRGRALTKAKAGKAIAAKTCVNPVAEQYQLGQQVGVTGTPAIVTSTGKLLPGYMPADILAETLGVPTS